MVFCNQSFSNQSTEFLVAPKQLQHTPWAQKIKVYNSSSAKRVSGHCWCKRVAHQITVYCQCLSCGGLALPQAFLACNLKFPRLELFGEWMLVVIYLLWITEARQFVICDNFLKQLCVALLDFADYEN